MPIPQITIIEKQHITPLGIISCGLKGKPFEKKQIETKTYKNGKSEIIQTASHKIELIEFKIKLPLYTGETVTDSSCWIWRIEKFGEVDGCGGQDLTAIQAYNQEWQLDIGTEDDEILNWRAIYDDWFPKRLAEDKGKYQYITVQQENGFETTIPRLCKNEKIHIQYLTAYDKKNDEENTWYAVDALKRDLEEWIGIN